MAIDYVSKVKTVVDILDAHNTSTASPDLSASLTSRVVDIYNDDPNITGGRNTKYPCLWVTIQNASEEETQIGDFTGRRKEKLITYDITGVYKKDGMSRNHEDVMKDFYQLASNTEAVIKRESTFSGTALHVGIVNTDFKTEYADQTWMKIFRITAEVKYFYS